MNYKKILAGVLATTMVMSSSLVAFATEPSTGTTTGEGKIEGTVNTDVFSVLLPTIPEDNSPLAFILDPEKLIESTTAAAYSGKTFDSYSTLYFANAEDKYTNTSDALVITNKSSMEVDVTIDAKLTGAEGINVTVDKTFAEDKLASMYLAVKVGEEETAITTDGIKVDASIEALADSYEYKWDTDTSKYVYVLKESLEESSFKKYTFNLTGASNSAGDWSSLAEAKPAVAVTWTVAPKSSAPKVNGTTFTYDKAQNLSIPVTLGNATDVNELQHGTDPVGTFTSLDKGAKWSYADGVITFNSGQFSSAVSGDKKYLKVVFNDEAKTSVVLTVSIK